MCPADSCAEAIEPKMVVLAISVVDGMPPFFIEPRFRSKSTNRVGSNATKALNALRSM